MKLSSKMLKTAVFTFLAAVLIFAVAPTISTVKAQGNATVNISPTVGGTTNPTSGTYTYTSGTTQTFVATATKGWFLLYWAIISPSGAVTTNSSAVIALTLSAGTYTLQPVFQALNVQIPPPAPSPNPASEAVVVVLAAVGGTTSPGPGTYTLVNATALMLTANPLSGWVFDHWVIGGYPLTHGAYNFTDTPTDNPYNVNHGYGYTYTYQPVFSLSSSPSATPTSSSSSGPTPSPTVPEYAGAALVVAVLVAVALAVAATTYAKRK